jgi:hypothetical protein
VVLSAVVVRHRSPRGNPGVSFAFEDASLTVTINELRRVGWVYANTATPNKVTVGSGVMWLNGRLTAAAVDGQVDNPDARRFLSLITELGLSFGAIEAELRVLTDYHEGDL